MYSRQAYAEVDDFLEVLDDDTRNEIPLGLRKFFKENRDNSYHISILESNIQSLREETLSIIAFLNLSYWCKDGEERKRLKRVYARNEEIYQNKLRKKYNPDNVFNTKSNNTIDKSKIEQESISSNQLTIYKESKFKNFINKLKKLFKII